MENFVIDDALKANWAVKKIREHRSQIARLEAERDAFIDEYQRLIQAAFDACEKNCAPAQAAVDSLIEKLLDYAQNNLPFGKQSIALPEGTLAFRKQQPRFFLDSDGSAPSATNQEFLEQLNFYYGSDIEKYVIVETRKTFDWNKFKKTLSVDDEGKVFDENGERLAILSANIPPDKFEVKTE